VIKFQI